MPSQFRVPEIGKKFTILILRNMMHFGQKHFSEFLEIEWINPKTLSLRLKEMQKDGLVERNVYAGTPVRIEYRLTEKGLALKPLLEQMMLFSMQHYPEQVCRDGRPKTVQDLMCSATGG